jgi:Fe-S-cluster-containing hydrogenase component 2
MVRNIISIDEEKCIGCGLCVTGCHQGALEIVDGKAKLISESYCDGLGKCLPKCPTGALSIVERKIEEVEKSERKKEPAVRFGGCPSMQQKVFDRQEAQLPEQAAPQRKSQLRQWPVQIQLVAPNAGFFDGAKLLIAADCTAYAHPNIHEYMKNKITLIGCPKLDEVDYSEKLGAILKMNDIQSITVLRMEVPCCGGIVAAVKNALVESGKMIPWNVVTIGTNGEVVDE